MFFSLCTPNFFRVFCSRFFALIVSEVAEVAFGDVGDGHGGDFLDGDDNAEVFLDAFDGAFHAGKGTFGDLHFLAGLAGKVEVVEEDDLVVGFGDNTDEVVHLFVGDIEYFLVLVVVFVVHGVHDVAQGFVLGFVTLDGLEVLQGDADEDEVGDGWSKVHRGGVFLLELQGHVGFFYGFFLFEQFSQFPEECRAGVVDADGEPVNVGIFQHTAMS